MVNLFSFRRVLLSNGKSAYNFLTGPTNCKLSTSSIKLSNIHDSLITTPELVQRLQKENEARSNFQLVDTRNKKQYKEGHIVHSRLVPDFFTYMLEVDETSSKQIQTFSAEWTKILGEAGVKKDHEIVVYENSIDGSEGFRGSSCRAYSVLTSLGCQGVKVLEGGYSDFKQHPEAQNFIQTGEMEENPVDFAAETNEIDKHISTKDDVLNAINNPDKQTLLVDVRDTAEWLGVASAPGNPDLLPRKGRIPGSIWIPWGKFMKKADGIATFKNNEEIQQLVAEQTGKANLDQDVIVYCFKGARAANAQVALRKAGFKNVTNYLASWNEWAKIPELPIDDQVLKA